MSVCVVSESTATHCNSLQHIATHCIVDLCVVTVRVVSECSTIHCNTLQRTATHCDVNVCGDCVCGEERWGAGVKTQKNVRGEIGGWGREPFHENYAPSLSTIYDGA